MNDIHPASPTPPQLTLPSGETFPSIGYGTFGLYDKEETAAAIVTALETGYRLIDTAANYNNEEGVGEGVRRSSIPRSDIIISSKVWPSDLGYKNTVMAFDQTMERLGLEYLDLYLIHWPCSAELNAGSWKAMEDLQAQGRVRHIGVSNFTVPHLQALAATANTPPLVNQVEFHPLYANREIWQFCRQEGILIEAWGPLMKGKAFDSHTLSSISRKHGKTPAQVVLRWCLQKGAVPIPKTKTPSRMLENISIFDFHLDDADMSNIDCMDTGEILLGPDPNAYQFCPQQKK